MRFIKFLVVCLVLCVAVVGVAFIPGVQRAVFLKFVPGASVEYLCVGLSKVESRNLAMPLEDAMSVRLKQLSFSGFSLVKLLTGRVQAKALSVKGLEVNVPYSGLLRKETQVAQAGPFDLSQPLVCAGFSGASRSRELPITLDKLDVEGHLRIGSQTASRFSALGGGFAPSASGYVDFDVEADLDLLSSMSPTVHEPLALRAFHSKGRVQVAQTKGGGLGHIQKDQTVTLKPRNTALPEEKLKVRSVVKLKDGARSFDVDMEVVDLRKEGAEPLLTFNGVVGEAHTKGPFTFAFQSGQLAPLLETLKLPNLAVTGSGNVDLKAGQALQLDLQASGRVDALGRLDARLKPLPQMSFSVNTHVSLDEGSEAHIRILEFQAQDAANTAHVELKALNPFSVDLQTGFPLEPIGSALTIKAQGIPVAWAQGLVAAQGVPLGLKAGQVGVQGELRAQQQMWELEAQAQLASLSLDYAGQPKIRDISWEGPLWAHYGKAGWDLKSTGWTSHSQSNLWAQGDWMMAQKERIHIEGTLEAWPRKLIGQPIGVEMQIYQWPEAQLNGTFNLALGEEALHLKALEFLVEQESGQPWMQLDVKPGLVISMQDPYTSLKGQGRIASGVLHRLPLSIFSPLVKGFVFSGDLERFSFECQTQGESIFLNMPEPIQIKDLDVIQNGQTLIEDLDIRLKPSLELKSKDLYFDLGIIELKKNEVNLLQGKASGHYPYQEGGLPVVQWEFLAQLPQMVQRTLLQTILEAPRSGTFAIEGVFNETLQLKLGLRDLKPNKGNGFIDRLLLDIHAQPTEQGSWEARVPMRMVAAGGGSELEFTGTLKKNHFELSATGPQLVVDDLLFLAGFLKDQEVPQAATGSTKQQQTAASTPPPTPFADKQPFWFPHTGQVLLDVGRISFMRNALDGLKGRLTLEPNALNLESIQATQAGAPIRATARVDFDAQADQPYKLKSDLSIEQWNVGAILKRMLPEDPPVIEGLFSVQAVAKSEGRTLEGTLEQIAGTCTLSGGPGLVRGLAYVGDGAQAGAAIGGLALNVLGGVTNRPGLTALSRISSYFDDLPYERLDCILEREADQDIVLKAFNLDGPVAGVRAQGSVRYHPHRPFMNQPLQLTLELGAKNALADDLQSIGLTSKRPGEDGYYWTTDTFEITGTPAQPDTSKLWSLVRKAAISAFDRPEPKPSNQKLKERPVDKAQDAIEGLFRGLF